ncbi:MAG: hypothetical protein QM690_11765 [Sphingobium sp.]
MILCRWSSGAALLAMLGVAALALRDEIAVHATDRLAQLAPNDALEAVRAGRVAAEAGNVPRGALNLSLVRTRAGWATPDPALKAALLSAARTDLRHALAARPRWGAAHVAETYLDFVQWGAGDRRTHAAFAKSYRDAPFINDAAPWRLTYGADQWQALSPVMQRHVLDEAIWFARTEKSYRAVNEIFRQSDALEPFRQQHRAWFNLTEKRKRGHRDR